MAVLKEQDQRGSYKRLSVPARIFGTVALTSAAIFGPSCIQVQENPQATEGAKGELSRVQKKDIEGSSEVFETYWNYDDLAFSQYPFELLAAYKVEVFQPSTFYPGEAPLVYYNYQIPALGWGGTEINVVDEYSNFVNLYATDGIYVTGVQTFKYEEDEQGPILRTILAEAVRETPNDNQSQVVTFREYHYDDEGDVTFEAVSKYDPLGQKVSEEVISGEKQVEYYFQIQTY